MSTTLDERVTKKDLDNGLDSLERRLRVDLATKKDLDNGLDRLRAELRAEIRGNTDRILKLEVELRAEMRENTDRILEAISRQSSASY